MGDSGGETIALLTGLRDSLLRQYQQETAMAACWRQTARQCPKSREHYARLAVEWETKAATLRQQIAAFDDLCMRACVPVLGASLREGD